MAIEYKVIAEFDLFQYPSIFQSLRSRAKQFAAAVEEALNRMASSGWRLVTTQKDLWSGITYFTFERESHKAQAVAPSTAIREKQASGRG